MKEKKYVVGIDCGTTSSKTVIFDLKGNAIGQGQKLNPLYYPSQGRVECDGPAMIETLYDTTKEAIESSGIDPEEIAALSCCMFRCTAITRDKDGGFTTPIIIWQDLRGVEMEGEMEEQLKAAGISKEELYDRCGMPLAGTYPLAKLLWVKKYQPEAYENCTRIHTMMGLMTKAYGADDYYDDLNDTPWLQMNGEDFYYDEKLVKAFGLDMEKLAPLAKTGEIVGKVTPEVAERTGLAVGTPIVIGTGDQQTACLGVGCTKEGIGYACGGTAGITAGKSMNILRDPDRKCYVLGTPDGAYVMEGQSNAAASAFKWFKDTIARVEDSAAKHVHLNPYDILTNSSTFSKPGANGVFYLPYMQGANVPNYDLNARGTYIGMTLATAREDLIRATMEGIVFDLKDMLLAMLDANVPEFDTVRITGGIAVSDVWNQIQADIYNWNVETVEVSEATALGCAIVASVGAGLYKDFQEAVDNMVRVTKRYTPNPKNVEVYKDAYEVWRTIFKDLHQNTNKMIADFQEKYRDL
ncbi:MAG: xylulose kinase [Lachnospiraceae bacterium]|nr:xylulose kinase [Lachnospiraceae bacterium]